MYVPSLISIHFVLFKICPGQVSIMKKWLRGDNSVNIQDRIIVFVHCPFPNIYLSINQIGDGDGDGDFYLFLTVFMGKYE